MHSLKERHWWNFQIHTGDLEAGPARISDLMPFGYHILTEDTISCYLELSEAELGHFKELLAQRGVSLLHEAQVEEDNWVQRCQAVWQPLLLSRLAILPVADSLAVPPPCDRPVSIRIIPGLGFGTGEHATTAMVLELIEECSSHLGPESRVLDVGTGSGILAIAAAKLLETNVDACDIDAAALENARENISMNGLDARVALWHGPIDQATGPYDLIIANIYAEVLEELEPWFAKLLKESGSLMLSGVMNSKAAGLCDVFAASGWSLTAERSREGWSAFLFERAIPG